MRVFIAGATGTIGRPLVGALVGDGHEVIGLTRTPSRRAQLESAGASAVVADALDAEAVSRAVRGAQPTHLAHLLTALPPAGALRPRDLRATNALRTRGTANLLRAAREAGMRRVVAESFMGVYGAADFTAPRGEDDPLPDPGRGALRDTVLALRDLEAQLARASSEHGLETVALRFGGLYGPGVPSADAIERLLRRRRMFVPRGADGVLSFVHVDDAVDAIRLALTHPAPGRVYNIVDDEPMPLTTFLALAADAIGAPPPRTLPAWIVRLVAPVAAEGAFLKLALSNARARRELGWQPRYPSIRTALGPDA